MKKGGKRPRTKGEPAFYDEMKKRVNLTLTPTSIEGLDELAEAWGVSRSELMERIGRGVIPVPKPEEVNQLKKLLNT